MKIIEAIKEKIKNSLTKVEGRNIGILEENKKSLKESKQTNKSSQLVAVPAFNPKIQEAKPVRSL